MANISSLIGVDWYFGIAFADPTNFTNQISVADTVVSVLGDNLIALQMGRFLLRSFFD